MVSFKPSPTHSRRTLSILHWRTIRFTKVIRNIVHHSRLGVWLLRDVTADRIHQFILQIVSHVNEEIRRRRFARAFILIEDLRRVGNHRHGLIVVLAPQILFEVSNVDPVVTRGGCPSVYEG